MHIVVGLGNPGREYNRNRHNVGFSVVNAIAETQNSKFKAQRNFKAHLVETKLSKVNPPAREAGRQMAALNRDEVSGSGSKVILVKPTTFMNRSGEAVKAVVDYYCLDKTQGDLLRKTPCVNDSLFVVHDELDLPLGVLQIRRNIGAGGHKGVQSVIDYLGTRDFVRFRVGVAKKKQYVREKFSNRKEDYLLSDFTKGEMEVMGPAIERAADAVIYAIENGVDKAMNKYN